jgi:hypothetical protein
VDVVLSVKDRNPVRLRLVAKPADHIRVLLHKLGLKIPNRPNIIENVVNSSADLLDEMRALFSGHDPEG